MVSQVNYYLYFSQRINDLIKNTGIQGLDKILAGLRKGPIACNGADETVRPVAIVC
jgi:hypothetical protein